jgi:transposase-like protein
MERLPQQKYTKEFRQQAVRVVHEQKRTIPEAARRLVSRPPVRRTFS